MHEPHRRCFTCGEQVDEETGTGISWLGQYGRDWGPPDTDGADAKERAIDMVRPYCPNHHRVWPASSILVGYFGPKASGKDSIIQTMSNCFDRSILAHYGIDARIDGDDRTILRRRAEKPQATPVPTDLEPYVPTSWHLRRSSGALPPALVAFNVAGEQFATADNADDRSLSQFILETDIFVVTIPPEALPQLPQSLRSPHQDPEKVLGDLLMGLGKIADFLHDAGVTRTPTVVLTLTKCDRYKDFEWFPQVLLEPRKRPRLRQQVEEDQVRIARFIVRCDGRGLLHAASELAGEGNPVFLSATSSSAGDDLNLEGGTLPGPSSAGDPTRTLDPVLIHFMRSGLGANYD